ncbi:M1 family metallopeptidase [Thiorhodovibrio frisius]|uniref:Peptidase M1 membrane alanine aminopeptidase domain-containing protein n=1 Tax=Thiorhodovibrio frisius TaxID=631362 RepID=H8YYJ2_9GAMM|nr:M1 family aminopeptidase [Thiorhodovibrio frisius]EIC23518.1 hypothetical protein Thi970DRAFT_01189 [Thiorhodovibrio frisius]WPL23395.1 Aminopeptidase N [Thiorhodovibrio frisius]
MPHTRICPIFPGSAPQQSWLAGLVVLLVAVLLPIPAKAAPPPGNDQVRTSAHALVVKLNPRAGEIIANDRLTLPEPMREVNFALHRNLHPELASAGRLHLTGSHGHLHFYRAELPSPATEISLHYRGRIRHGLQELTEGMGRSRQQSLGTISADGVFLSGYSGWYPRLDNTMDSFTLAVGLPAGWSAVSQGVGPGQVPPLGADDTPDTADSSAGEAPSHEHSAVQVYWQESHPQDEIYLIAAPFEFYQQAADGVDIQAWLREKDDTLAKRYLDATRDYLKRYSTLIGQYPYSKFALVENFWESGYGMPSFTLLGPQVLRLPFILHSSYPHEILHNWWGNGVFVDWDSGNWSEGLTAYLADHLNKALVGQGSAYRRDQLKAYADYVRAGSDMPLIDFRARHSQASQAIGYGKSLMVFHMLRQLLGDAPFIAGLRLFYAQNKFQSASWQDIQQAFEQTSEQDLNAFFSAWTKRPGALRLSLEGVESHQQPDGRYRVSAGVRQLQSEPPFPLRVPVIVHDSLGAPHSLWLAFNGERERSFALTLDQPPLRLAVDPVFDSFRMLEPGETPVSLSNLFGAEAGTLILPAAAPAELLRAYRQLADDWQKGQPHWRILSDADIEQLPSGAVWLLGWENRFLPEFSRDSTNFQINTAQRLVKLSGEDAFVKDQIPVLTRFSNPGAAGPAATGAKPGGSDSAAPASRDSRPMGWLAAQDPAAIAGLARKLPHYGKYGYLLFAGAQPTNQRKGQWPVRDSPLMHWFSDKTGTPLAPVKRQSLIDALAHPHPHPHQAP